MKIVFSFNAAVYRIIPLVHCFQPGVVEGYLSLQIVKVLGRCLRLNLAGGDFHLFF